MARRRLAEVRAARNARKEAPAAPWRGSFKVKNAQSRAAPPKKRGGPARTRISSGAPADRSPTPAKINREAA